MDAVTATAQMTATEFLALPYDERTRYRQLIDGELVMNDPTWRHNGAQVAILTAVRNWTREARGRGRVGLPLDVRIDERSVYKPDVVWYSEGRVPSRDDPAPYPVPDLAVEVRSPSTWRFDIGRKKDNYERHGVAELWLVDTAADVVFVFRRSHPRAPHFDVSLDYGSDQALTSRLLPGFELAVGEVFADR
jgi:Uma2 family endonuclease